MVPLRAMRAPQARRHAAPDFARPARCGPRAVTAPSTAANSAVTRCGRDQAHRLTFPRCPPWMLRRASSDGTQGRTALDDRDAQRGRSSRLSSSHSQDIDGVFSGTMDYGAVESSSSLIRPGSDVLGTEVPGLQDSSHDHELFEMLAADKAHAGEAPQPRFLRWLPTWCGPLCLSLSIAGVLFLVRPTETRARQPRPRRIAAPNGSTRLHKSCAPLGRARGCVRGGRARKPLRRRAPGLLEGNLTANTAALRLPGPAARPALAHDKTWGVQPPTPPEGVTKPLVPRRGLRCRLIKLTAQAPSPQTRPCSNSQLVLSGLTSSGYEYIRLSGDYEKHSTNLLWAAVIYACTGALSVACICAQRPARPAVALHRR